MRPTLYISPATVVANWQTLNSVSSSEVLTGAVVKADAYGLGVQEIAPRLAARNVSEFFVADCEEGVGLRRIIGPKANIFVLSGYDPLTRYEYTKFDLIPLICDPISLNQFSTECEDLNFGVLIETGHNRLALELTEKVMELIWRRSKNLSLLASHLACADERETETNSAQLGRFKAILNVLPESPASLSGTDGIFLGSDYHFALTRPGIGLYCSTDRETLRDSIRLEASTLVVRSVAKGESVGYGHTWIANVPSRIATISIGYADGLPREHNGRIEFFAHGIACPVVGRVSMDLVNIDVTHLNHVPSKFELIGSNQTLTEFALKIGAIPNSCLVRFGQSLKKVYSESQF